MKTAAGTATHTEDSARVGCRRQEVGDAAARLDTHVRKLRDLGEQLVLGVRFRPGRQGETVETAGLSEIIDDIRGKAEGLQMVLPIRVLPLDGIDDAAQFRLYREGPHLEQPLG